MEETGIRQWKQPAFTELIQL